MGFRIPATRPAARTTQQTKQASAGFAGSNSTFAAPGGGAWTAVRLPVSDQSGACESALYSYRLDITAQLAAAAALRSSRGTLAADDIPLPQ
jgi:hypothetical protein